MIIRGRILSTVEKHPPILSVSYLRNRPLRFVVKFVEGFDQDPRLVPRYSQVPSYESFCHFLREVYVVRFAKILALYPGQIFLLVRFYLNSGQGSSSGWSEPGCNESKSTCRKHWTPQNSNSGQRLATDKPKMNLDRDFGRAVLDFWYLLRLDSATFIGRPAKFIGQICKIRRHG